MAAGFSKREVDDLFGRYLAQSAPELLAAPTSPSHCSDSSAASETSCSSDSDSATATRKPALKRKRESTPSGAKPSTNKKSKPRNETERKERRRLQNRMAAATSREKKKKYHMQLHSKVETLSAENQTLQARIQQLLEENKQLKEEASRTPDEPKPTPPCVTATDFQIVPLSTSTMPNITAESAAGGDDELACLADGLFAPNGALAFVPPHGHVPEKELAMELEGFSLPSLPLDMRRDSSTGSDCFPDFFFPKDCSFSASDPVSQAPHHQAWLTV